MTNRVKYVIEVRKGRYLAGLSNISLTGLLEEAQFFMNRNEALRFAQCINVGYKRILAVSS